MTGLEDAALLAVVAIGSAFAASALARARWPRRSPAAAILLWQALGLASGLAPPGPARRRALARPGLAPQPYRPGTVRAAAARPLRPRGRLPGGQRLLGRR